MPRLLADHAVYQGSLTPAHYQRAGFQVINVKTSHGMGTKNAHPDRAGHVADARGRKMGLASFHWLTGDHDGTTQAEHAYEQLQALGLHRGAAHTVDVEEQADDGDQEAPPTWAHVRDYILLMEELLRRPVMVYSARWYWPKAKEWTKASLLTPYLMAAPDTETGTAYPGSYPGDASPLWNTHGWGGWTRLAVMQYAVSPLTYPDGTTSGTIKVSKAAVRDDKVWAALTTEVTR